MNTLNKLVITELLKVLRMGDVEKAAPAGEHEVKCWTIQNLDSYETFHKPEPFRMRVMKKRRGEKQAPGQAGPLL